MQKNESDAFLEAPFRQRIGIAAGVFHRNDSVLDVDLEGAQPLTHRLEAFGGVGDADVVKQAIVLAALINGEIEGVFRYIAPYKVL